MITNKTAREFVIAKKLFPDISTSVIETDTVTGAIASFETNMSAPIVNGVFEFNPVQEGTGDPSPSNPRAIHGYTGMNVTKCGKNLFDVDTISAIEISDSGDLRNGCIFSHSGTYKISGTQTGNFYIYGKIKSGSTYGNVIYLSQGSPTTISKTITLNQGEELLIYDASSVAQMRDSKDRLSVLQIEVGSTATTYEPYTATTYPISWQTEAGTVYGGLLNATTGELKPFKEYDSYNGETLTGPWLCSQAPYVAGTTPPTGSQVVDLGAYDTTVQLTPQEVRTLLGENNIYHDCNGDSTITYKKSVPGPTTTDKRQFLPLIYGKKYKYNERRY